MDEGGFITLSRKFFQSDFWKEPRELSRAEAWLDMIARANYSTGTQIVEGRCLSLHRGDLVASVRYAAIRWNWSRGKVERFFDCLEKANRIKTRIESGVSIVSLCNYNQFNVEPRHLQAADRASPETLAGQFKQGKEGELNLSAREGSVPSMAEFCASFMADGIPGEWLEAKWAWFEGNNAWLGRNGELKNYGVLVRQWWKRERETWKKNATSNPNTRKGHDRNAGTANAKRSDDYSAAAKR